MLSSGQKSLLNLEVELIYPSLVPGLQIEITGSQFNDGIYNIEDVRYGRDRWVSEDPFGQQRAPEGTLDYSLDNNNTTTVLT